MVEAAAGRVRRRAWNLAGAGICAGLLAAAWTLELGWGMQPCPLCVVQRAGIAALGVLFLVAAVHHGGTGAARIYGAAMVVVAGLGAVVAGRHVWIQTMTSGIQECGAGLAFMLERMPLFEVLIRVMRGTGDCADLHPVLGLPIPAWTLAAFLLLGAGGGVGNWRYGRGR